MTMEEKRVCLECDSEYEKDVLSCLKCSKATMSANELSDKFAQGLKKVSSDDSTNMSQSSGSKFTLCALHTIGWPILTLMFSYLRLYQL